MFSCPYCTLSTWTDGCAWSMICEAKEHEKINPSFKVLRNRLPLIRGLSPSLVLQVTISLGRQWILMIKTLGNVFVSILYSKYMGWTDGCARSTRCEAKESGKINPTFKVRGTNRALHFTIDWQCASFYPRHPVVVVFSHSLTYSRFELAVFPSWSVEHLVRVTLFLLYTVYRAGLKDHSTSLMREEGNFIAPLCRCDRQKSLQKLDVFVRCFLRIFASGEKKNFWTPRNLSRFFFFFLFRRCCSEIGPSFSVLIN